MFELPEFVNLSKQINDELIGLKILKGQLGNSPHKFVWYNRSHEEFETLTEGKTIGESWSKGRWLFIPLAPGYLLLLGECGGKLLYHEAGSPLPKKYHLHLAFEDESFLTLTTQMWGAIELYTRGDEQERKYIKDMRVTPIEPEFSFSYFDKLVDDLILEKKRSVKSLLTQDQIIPGLGNAIAQDIMFNARLNPRFTLSDLTSDQRRMLFEGIRQTVNEVIDGGGRYDEYDLFNNRGRYIRIMDKNAVGKPCPRCSGEVRKTQYLGGACYFCENCQE